MIFKNKKGGMVLRDMIFLLLIFAGIMTFATLFVTDVANSYGNENMSAEYGTSSLNTSSSSLFGGLQGNVSSMKNETQPQSGGGIIGAFKNLGGTLSGVGTVIGIVFKAPIYFGNSIGAILETLMVPKEVSNFISIIISVGLYVLIIFVIISAALRGGKV